MPVQVKWTPTAAAARRAGAAPSAPMPPASARSGRARRRREQHLQPAATPRRHAHGPGPSALFEAPTAADIDKALSVARGKGRRPARVCPVAPDVVHRPTRRPISDDDPTRVFDATVAESSRRTRRSPARAR
jgi:hypothetical protein